MTPWFRDREWNAGSPRRSPDEESTVDHGAAALAVPAVSGVTSLRSLSDESLEEDEDLDERQPGATRVTESGLSMVDSPVFEWPSPLPLREGPGVGSEPKDGAPLHDCMPHRSKVYDDVVAGLSQRRKTLPCKYFYDERGSQLFDAICELDEYYQTRTEDAILKNKIGEIADRIGVGSRLVEYGSGSSTKTRTLLDSLTGLRVYVPVDISRDHLSATARRLSAHYPHIPVMPVCADYTHPFSLPASPMPIAQTTVFFPGSTIGNFDPTEAVEFLATIAAVAGPHGGLLIGVDLKKDCDLLHAAYNDSQGVTAEFNLNILRHINSVLDADFDIDAFQHHAFYNDTEGRIEMHLVSLADQQVTVGRRSFCFDRGETIHTEVSYKYTVEEFASLASRAGLSQEQVWTDPKRLFSVQWLTVA